jgi:hypothetical protein
MGLVSFVVDPVVSVQRTGARKNLVSFDYRIGLSATLLGLTR